MRSTPGLIGAVAWLTLPAWTGRPHPPPLVDFFADDDPPAAMGRALGLIDILTGSNGAGTGALDERNVALVSALVSANGLSL